VVFQVAKNLVRRVSPAASPAPEAPSSLNGIPSSAAASLRAVTFQPGAVFRGYHVVRCINAGGMSEVYEVYEPYVRKSFALKVLQARYAQDPLTVARAREEASAFMSIDHPNIVRVSSAGAEDGIVWMVMDLLEGSTLRELLACVPRLLLLQAIFYAMEAADGLGALHERGIVHRDLKPENLIITQGNQLKIIDLGTAKFYAGGLQTTGKVPIGTAAYMSPEHLNAEKVDARSDVYALGFNLHEMLVGTHPFKGEGEWPNNMQLGNMHFHQKPRPLAEVIPGFPPGVSAVVEKAVEKDPEKRFQSMHAMKAALRVAKQEAIADGTYLRAEAEAMGISVEGWNEPGSRRQYAALLPPPRGELEPEVSGPRVVAEAAPGAAAAEHPPAQLVTAPLSPDAQPRPAGAPAPPSAGDPRQRTTQPSRSRTATSEAADVTLRSLPEDAALDEVKPLSRWVWIWIAAIAFVLTVTAGVFFSRRDPPLGGEAAPAAVPSALPASQPAPPAASEGQVVPSPAAYSASAAALVAAAEPVASAAPAQSASAAAAPPPTPAPKPPAKPAKPSVVPKRKAPADIPSILE
jgi:serine/threonine-protein kinase